LAFGCVGIREKAVCLLLEKMDFELFRKERLAATARQGQRVRFVWWEMKLNTEYQVQNTVYYY